MDKSGNGRHLPTPDDTYCDTTAFGTTLCGGWAIGSGFVHPLDEGLLRMSGTRADPRNPYAHPETDRPLVPDGTKGRVAVSDRLVQVMRWVSSWISNATCLSLSACSLE